MARSDHLPIDRAAFDLAVHIEKIVRHFSRYHKYTLGTQLRESSQDILKRIIEANSSRRDREAVLLELRQQLEWLKALARLCHESGGFASTTAYLYVSEQIVNLAKQNEGWLKETRARRKRRERNEENDSEDDAQPRLL